MSYARAPLAVRISTAVAITAVILFGTAAAGRAESRRVVVRVYETGTGDPAVRGDAIRTAAAILDATGIAVEWYDCTDNGRRPVCQDARRAGNFIARIMPALSAAAMPRQASVEALDVQGDTEPPLGFAVVDPDTGSGMMATLFHDQIEAVARRTGVARSELLGRALAHEVGHLLLGVRGHSRSGLMRAVWTDDELTRHRPEDWLFTSADQERLQRLWHVWFSAAADAFTPSQSPAAELVSSPARCNWNRAPRKQRALAAR